MRAIQITEFGGPEVLRLRDVPDPRPGEGEELVDVLAAGVNYADTHQAENSYLAPQRLPLVPGMEVVGRTGDGRRVVALLASGGYAEKAVVVPAHSREVPESVDDGTALALVLQGLTAWHLLRTCAHLAPGETVVVHAGAGGVGSLAVQLARAWGAGRVLATASTPGKRELAEALGADASVPADAPDLAAALLAANHGRPVDVVLEMVGGSTFDASLAALAPFGRLVTFGLASRTPPQPVEPARLMARGHAVVGFWLAYCLGRPELFADPLGELFDLAVRGTLRPLVGARYPLADARHAHEDLRARRTTGKLVLDPAG